MYVQRTVSYRIIFTALKSPHLSPFYPSLLPEPLAATDLFIDSIVLSFPEYHVAGIIHYIAFSDWLLSLPICIKGWSVSFCSFLPRFFLQLNNGHLGRFQFWGNIKKLLERLLRFLHGYMFSNHLDKHLVLQMLDCIVSIWLGM